MSTPIESSNQLVARTVRPIVQGCHDNAHAFEHAAKETSDAALRLTFEGLAQQRHAFALALDQSLSRYGAHVPEYGTVKGDLRHAWMDVRATIDGHRPPGILAECEHAEHQLLSLYEKTMLKSSLPQELDTMIAAQLVEVSEAHAKLRRMRDQA